MTPTPTPGKHDCTTPPVEEYYVGQFWTCECGRTWAMSVWVLPGEDLHLWVEPTVNTIKNMRK